MRPRRRVALYSEDEHRAGVLAYLLELRLSLAVTRCRTAAEAAMAGCELTILILSEREDKAGILNLRGRLHGSSLVYDPHSLLADEECEAAAYLRGQIDSSQLLDKVRALLVRRRGPKPSTRLRASAEPASLTAPHQKAG